jgi:multiple sugar transport system substrate-binding protein
MIELSVMEHGRDFARLMRELLDQFERNTQLKVNLRVLNWQEGWADLVKVALYNDGPHVSEIGSTWLSEFVGMGSLRPFGLHELVHDNSPQCFLLTAWAGVKMTGRVGAGESIWAMPWVADTRLIYYRPALFERAGIDPEWAFQSPQTLLEACLRFQAAGISNPIVVPSQFSHITLHNIATWLWQSGSDFLTPDRRQVQFDTPAARTALSAYFDLVKYLSPDARGLDNHGVHAVFRSGAAAAVLTGTWLQGSLTPEIAAATQHALPPGPAYLGGSQLVIWKHADRLSSSALALVRFLTSANVQLHLVKTTGLFPNRVDVLAQETFQQDPFNRQVAACLHEARAFPTFQLWGLVEKRLIETFTAIWADILSADDPDVPAIVDKHVFATARRLNTILRTA